MYISLLSLWTSEQLERSLEVGQHACHPPVRLDELAIGEDVLLREAVAGMVIQEQPLGVSASRVGGHLSRALVFLSGTLLDSVVLLVYVTFVGTVLPAAFLVMTVSRMIFAAFSLFAAWTAAFAT